jgi:hypothetical protein
VGLLLFELPTDERRPLFLAAFAFAFWAAFTFC